jgi:putative toxin-antitoxin system antitoxin component (TIGR02293 family)
MAKAYKLTSPKKQKAVARLLKGEPRAHEAHVAYFPSEKARVIQFMGMPERKRTSSEDDIFFIDLIRKGLPKKVLDHLLAKMDISEDEMAAILHVSKRTLQRRTTQESLNEEQSERLIELAKLYSKGEEVLGTLENFKSWMNTSLLALGNKRPKDFLDTSIGIGILLDVLGRIEQGVFS